MSERINKGVDSPPVQVLLAAMQAARTAKGRRVDPWPNLLVDVTLTVDGIEVPFMETLRQVIDNENRAVEKRAEVLALRALSEVGLDEAVAAIREANFKLARCMGKIVSAIPDDVKE